MTFFNSAHRGTTGLQPRMATIASLIAAAVLLLAAGQGMAQHGGFGGFGRHSGSFGYYGYSGHYGYSLGHYGYSGHYGYYPGHLGFSIHRGYYPSDYGYYSYSPLHYGYYPGSYGYYPGSSLYWGSGRGYGLGYSHAVAPLYGYSTYYSPSPAVVIGSPAQSSQQVLIDVQVPANAVISFDGQDTAQGGTQRQFVSPPLTPGQEYSYEVQARWKGDDGREIAQSRLVKVRAGERVSIAFPEPARKAE